MNEHDRSYKNIFSHAEVVADMLRGFVHEDWVERIDYSTLEKVSGSYVTDDLRDRADDIIWRVQSPDGWLYIYLLIEFQSRVDPYMALRIMVYTGLLYQDLIKSGAIAPGRKLPPVFPIVIYNGEGKWTAARDMADLIEPFDGCLAAYRPSQRHFVLDEGRVPESERNQSGNTLADIIQLETSPEPETVRQVVSRLTQRMKEARYDSLRRALVVWINRVVIKRVIPGENVPELNELQEIDNMLAERVDQWVEKWKQEGHQTGRQEGRQEGEGRLLTRLLERRFGVLPNWVKERIDAATSEQLEMWGERIFDTTTLEAFFDSH